MSRRAALAAVALATFAGCGGADHENGPVDAGADTEASAWVRVGKPVAWGWATLTNRSNRSGTLESVEVVGAPDQLEVLGIKASRHDRPYSIGIGRWPVEEISVQPVRGTVLPPTSAPHADLGVEIIVGVRSTQEGIWRTKGLRVTYRVGGERFTEEFGQVVEICSDAERCPPAD